MIENPESRGLKIAVSFLIRRPPIAREPRYIH
jgi:hypothetical protein